MNVIKIVSFTAVFALLFSACGPTLSPFTQKLYNDSGWSESELKRIQFYLSDDIVLRRQVTEGSSEIIRGEIKMVNGRKVEEVLIKRNTPGVFVFSPKEKRFAVSFEASDDVYLMFGPNPKFGNKYSLLASDWKRRQGSVTYDGRKWNVDGSDALASLMVDLKKTRKVSVNSRVAKGRKID